MRTAVLEISSWRGISIGGEHYYGSLKMSDPYRSIELNRKMTSAQAAALNKKDRLNCYRRGSETSRFDTRAEVRRAGIALAKKMTIALLLEGQFAVAEPQKVLIAPANLKSKLERLYARAEKLNWDDHEKRLGAICDQWRKLTK